MPQTSILTLSIVARALRLVIAAVACVGVVRAQSPSPPKEGQAGAVRERRAGEASKPAPAAKTEAGEKGADAAVWSGNLTAAEETKGAAADAAEVEPAAGEPAAPAASGELSLEELRARVEAEKDKSARARLQRELLERLAAAGRTAEAVASLRAMLAEERFDPTFFYNVGNQLARLGESGAAVEAYRKAAGQRRGGYARAQHNLGVVLTRLGRWEEAEAALVAALRLENFTYAEASYNLGRLHALRGEAGRAIEEWGRTLRLRPDHAPAAAALARALAEDGDPEEALAVLDSFTARATRRGQPAPPELAAARAELASAASAPAEEEGREEGREARRPAGLTRPAGGAREAAPGRASLRPLVVRSQTYDFLRRARAAREAARLDQAVALYREAIESNGGYFAPADLELGFALSSQRRTDEAINQLLVVVRRSGSRYPVAFYHLGRLYEHAGQFAQAGDAYARAAELMGDTGPQFFADLSRAREKEGKAAEALAAMESYVRATGRLGDVPAWARERLARLRQKEAPAQPAAAK